MLKLKLATDPRWVNLAEKSLSDILTDHAYCEQKASTNAISLIEANPDKISWDCLSLNINAINILEKNIDKINWSKLSINPNSIKLLKKYPDKIDWNLITLNPNADELFYIYKANNEHELDVISFKTMIYIVYRL